MARTLPWLDSGATKIHQTVRPRPPKRQRTLDPNSDSDDNANARTVVHTKNQAAPTAVRTPSTSPPPQPPTEEFLRPGLSADDIYIMVEDEFLAVAQTFTKHLHHAEYIRLRKAAKERNASTVNNIPRPVDATTTMREETRRKKEAEARELKMKAAVQSIKCAKRAKVSLDESDVSDFEEDRQDDPWQGTHLQRFMTKSTKKNLPGLTGLQGVTSHTRAAAGYSKPEKRPSQPTRLFEPAQPKTGASKPTTVAKAASDSSSSSDTDDDDLDAPSRIPSYPPPRIPSRPPTTTATESIPIPTANQKPTHRVPETKHPTSTPSKLSHKPNPPPAPRPSLIKPSKNRIPSSPPPKHSASTISEHQPSVSEVRQRLKARREREEKERMQKRASNDGTIRGVDEIPLFLV